MSTITVGQENSVPINLYYEDHGSGKPIVLIHGFPLSGTSWEKQLPPLLNGGFRVITYDRRGFGKSSQPTTGYDYDTFAKDLDQLMTKLDLKEAILVGFSMGTGEVARYLGTYGSERVQKAVFISSTLPFTLKTEENPEGVDPSVFDEIQKQIAKDRSAYLTDFLLNFYNSDTYLGDRLSQEFFNYSWNIAVGASAVGTYKCVPTWHTDFRKDIARIKIPTLIVHGKADRILPIKGTGDRLHEALPGSRYVVIDGGPHGLIWTHADQLNPELLAFLK